MARPRMLGSYVYLSDASQPMRFRGLAMRPSVCKPHPFQLTWHCDILRQLSLEVILSIRLDVGPRVLRNLSIIYRILYVVSGPISGRLRKSGLYRIRMRRLSSYPRRRRTGGAGPLLCRR